MTGDRGLIRNSVYFSKELNMTGIRYGNITPTDIDFMIEYKNILFIFGEIKYNRANMTRGQEIAFERITDNLLKPAIFILCTHYLNTHYDNEKRIMLDICDVVKFRYRNKWYDGNCTVKELCDRFIKKIEGEL